MGRCVNSRRSVWSGIGSILSDPSASEGYHSDRRFIFGYLIRCVLCRKVFLVSFCF